MTKQTHTHRGTCQVCGRVQASDPGTALIAKHGYSVKDFGFFNGTCQGSDRLPLEVEQTFTLAIIVSLEARIRQQESRVVGLRDGSIEPAWEIEAWGVKANGRNGYILKTVEKASLASWEQERIVRGAISSAEFDARNCRSHIKSLCSLIQTRYGRDLYPALVDVGATVGVGTTFKLYDQTWTITGSKYVRSFRASREDWVATNGSKSHLFTKATVTKAVKKAGA